VTQPKPSLNLLRSLSDEHVLRALMAERQLTRADLAARTGLSKPTVSDSVRRLTRAGVLHDTGERTTGRGRVGSYYAFAEDIGAALVMSIAPDGIVAEIVNVYGSVLAHEVERVARAARPARVRRAIGTAADRAQSHAAARVRLAVISAADPVDRDSGRLVHLPDAPFLVGELSPPEVLAPLVSGRITVDNDVNWAARAERDLTGTTAPDRLDNFGYLHLGDGLGCAIVSDGDVRRGHQGIAGEIAHLTTRSRSGQATRFIDVFAELALRQPGTTAIDSDRIRTAAAGTTVHARRLRTALAAAVTDVLSAVVALADPGCIVIGGSWGPQPDILDSIAREFTRQPRHVPVHAARLTDQPALSGARDHALHQLRAVILTDHTGRISQVKGRSLDGAEP
jgi:predicted NBD/HSP70 family sugar kinase